MSDSLPSMPSRPSLIDHVMEAISHYSNKKNIQILKELPVQERTCEECRVPLKLISVKVPDWAKQWSVNGNILVPKEACGKGGSWKNTDWWLALFLLLECWHERVREALHGPIHSYSFRLNGWDTRVWDHAWGNRIALFLQEWISRNKGTSRSSVFGPLPNCNIQLSFDVDAISKTLPIRFKQSIFNCFNAARLALRFRPITAMQRLRKAFRFLWGNENWWTFGRIFELTQDIEPKPIFNFCATSQLGLKSWIMDPGYDLHDPKLQCLFKKIESRSYIIGLHPSFDSWNDESVLIKEKDRLEIAAGVQVKSARQHWLRFSWEHTWKSQEKAGLKEDTTLMFNDRPGFRNSSALRWNPWDPTSQAKTKIISKPTILMDSHLFDYGLLTPAKRKDSISKLIQESVLVGGVCCVLWHPHTLARDYGWQADFEVLLKELNKLK